jgi:hypothetical protein
MGYEIMNEPDTGTLPRDHATTQLVMRWGRTCWPG